MANLISDNQWLSIRAALRNATDTFFRKPVVYRKFRYGGGGGSLDRFNEDRQDTVYTDYTLEALVEFMDNLPGDTVIMEGGALDQDDVKVSFNFDYLQEQNLTKDVEINGVPYKMASFNDKQDLLFIDGEKYKVTKVIHDGQTKDKYVLVVVKGKKDIA